MSDPKFLKKIQEAGWSIASVKEDACYVRCPSAGCGMFARISEGGQIPKRIAPTSLPEIRLEKYSDIRDALMKRRQDLKLTTPELDDVTGLAEGHISKAERENPHRLITLNVLIVWANALGYRVALIPDELPSVTLRKISDTRPIEEARSRHPKFRGARRAQDRRA